MPKEKVKLSIADERFLEALFKIIEKNLDNTELDVEFLSKNLHIIELCFTKK